MVKISLRFLFYGVVLLVSAYKAFTEPSILLIAGTAFLWSIVGTWAMSYIGTAEERRAGSMPVQFCNHKGRLWPELEFVPWYKCQKCGARLKTRDVIAIVSYLLCRGKCRYCGRKYGSHTFKRELQGLFLGYFAVIWLYLLVKDNYIGEIEGTIY